MFFFFFFFESEVKRIIESELTGSETILPEYRSGDYVFDLFLPEGCRRLDFPPQTAIELKTKLVSDSVAQVTRMARASLKLGLAQHFVLVYEEEDSKKTRKEIKHLDNVRVLSLQELRNATRVTLDQELFPHDVRDTSIVPIPQNQDSLLQEAKGRFHQGDVSLFLGSGVGRSAGLPDWNGLIERMVEEVNGKNPDCEKYDYAVLEEDTRHSPIVMARYLKNALGDDSDDFVPLIKRVLYKNPPRQSKLVEAVRNMAVNPNVRRVITYNYDDLLEQSIGDQRTFSIIDGQNRPSPGTLPIYHVHGFVPRDDDPSFEENVVLSEDEYHLLYKEAFHWSNTEQLHALKNTTSFFIGLSLTDPNLRRLLDIANEIGTKDPPHFAFLRKSDYNQPEKAWHLFYTMGVKVLWFDEFDEVPVMLRGIVK